jgi:uncharacterized protein YegL
MNIQPVSGVAKRQMRMIYMVDASGSMSIDGKMDTLNMAMARAQGEIRQVAEANPHANVMVQTMKFSSGAEWTTPEPVAVSSFQWESLQADELSRSDPGWAREMRQQLNQAGAHAGKFKIGLQWFNRNDLDLHVVCPHGNEIYFGKKKVSCCGGWLDIDMNVNGETSSPVEHIVFGHSERGDSQEIAPGDYHISVVYYGTHDSDSSSDYRVLVDFDGQPYSNHEGRISGRGKSQIIETITVGGGGTVTGGAADSGTGGNTELGKALNLLGEALGPNHPRRAIPPLVVLLSDGDPTDEFQTALDNLNEVEWAKKAQRFAIAIGQDVDRDVLSQFTGDSQRVLDANNPEQLATMIQWCSTQVLQTSLSGREDDLPPPPPTLNQDSGDFTW